jgi:hypothetical protein
MASDETFINGLIALVLSAIPAAYVGILMEKYGLSAVWQVVSGVATFIAIMSLLKHYIKSSFQEI